MCHLPDIPFDDKGIFDLSLKDAKAAISTLGKEAFANFIKQTAENGVHKIFHLLSELTDEFDIVYNVEFDITVIEK